MGKIGTGDIQPVDNLTRIRIGRTRGNVLASAERFENELVGINHKIQLAETADQLLSQANAYIQEKMTSQTQLREIEVMARQKLITPAELEQSRAEHQALISREKDESLRKGLELLEERKRQELSQAPKPSLVIDRKTAQIDLTHPGGERKRFVYPHEGDFALLLRMAREANKYIPSRVLKEVLQRAGVSNNPSISVRYLRELLEKDPSNPEVVIQTGKAAATAYQLRAEVSFVKDRPKRASSVRPQVEGPRENPMLVEVFTSRLVALNHFAEQSDITLSDLIEILGPTRGEKPRNLTWPQAKSAMKKATSKLYIRNQRGLLTGAEQSTWTQMRESTGQQADLATKDVFLAKLETWFSKLPK